MLRVLTYNVAGLPEGISRSRPSVNMPRISPLLNAFDLVVVQEDFAFPTALRSALAFAHQSVPFRTGRPLDLGDGLSVFASMPFVGIAHEAWERCHGHFDSGSDCLTAKGFSVATHEVARGVFVDVYNLHMDAGRRRGDREARRAQIAQLGRALLARSRERAVVVAGDTNLWPRDEAMFTDMLRELGLTDACRALDCPDPERIDRVMYKDGGGVRLRARRWAIDERFVDEDGAPLSDHLPVAVDVAWSVR